MRVAFKDRLAALEISEHEFQLYWDLVVQSKTRYWKRHSYERDWFQVQKGEDQVIPLDKYQVVRHLTGEFWIAKQAPGITDFFVIDLDYDEGSDIHERYRAVCGVFGVPVVVRSSNSMGLHLYYFLQYRMERFELGETIGLLLENAGVELSGGLVETFPGTIDHLRLPLGLDSLVLDPVNLQTVGLMPGDSIEWMAEAERITLPQSSIPVNKSRSSATISSGPNSKRMKMCEQILHTGITKLGTRNEIELLLVQYFMYDLNMNDDEIEDRMTEFFDAQEYDHKSKEWRDSPNLVLNRIPSIISNLRKKYNKGQDVSHVPLSNKEFGKILEYSMVFARESDGKFGFEAYSYQQFLFHLFQYYKAQQNKIRVLSFNRRSRFGGTSKHTARHFKETSITQGLLTVISYPNRHRGLAGRYRLNHNFGINGVLSSLTEALTSSFPPSKLKNLYTRDIHKRITKEV